MEISVDRDKLFEIIRLVREAKNVPFFCSNRNQLVKITDIVWEMIDQGCGHNLPYLAPEIIRDFISSEKDLTEMQRLFLNGSFANVKQTNPAE